MLNPLLRSSASSVALVRSMPGLTVDEPLAGLQPLPVQKQLQNAALTCNCWPTPHQAEPASAAQLLTVVQRHYTKHTLPLQQCINRDWNSANYDKDVVPIAA